MTSTARTKKVMAPGGAITPSAPKPRPEPAPAADIEELMSSLETMDLAALRQVWSQRFGPAPRMRSVELVRLSLAWRIQAEAHGGLSAEARGQLSGRHAAPTEPMSAGTRLVREWGGAEHVVTPAEGGFDYNDRTWKSLSEIARAITGVRWNGPRFFGLRARTGERRDDG